MLEYILKNGLKLIYKEIKSELTSICISLNAGAGVEKEQMGVAHATEHMVYKGTKNRTEAEINKALTNTFGFNNAMTNYPYVIYYGTLLSEECEGGLELLSDILINPTFKNSGFVEEMDVIKEELKEWDEETEQYCEDKLYFNSFNDRRIKYPIIGTEESLKSITLGNIKDFYKKYYFPGNTTIAVVSSVDFETLKEFIDKYFGTWNNSLECKNHVKIKYEPLLSNKFINLKDGIKASKVEIICPIDALNENEIIAFKIFNEYFGEGINSILYDTLRTKNGLIYDVLTKISSENYIKLYKITFSASKENVHKAIQLFNECINKIKNNSLEEIEIEALIKSYKLKKLFREEKSIILAKELATYETMFGDYKLYSEEIKCIEKIKLEDILMVGQKVLSNHSIQVIN